MVDDRRRVVMPPELPPHSAVTIQQVGVDCWLVTRHVDEPNLKAILIPLIEKLPDDPEWDKTECSLAKAAARRLPEPE